MARALAPFSVREAEIACSAGSFLECFHLPSALACCRRSSDESFLGPRCRHSTQHLDFLTKSGRHNAYLRSTQANRESPIPTLNAYLAPTLPWPSAILVLADSIFNERT